MRMPRLRSPAHDTKVGESKDPPQSSKGGIEKDALGRVSWYYNHGYL